MAFGFRSRPLHVAQNVIVGLDFDGCIAYGAHLKVRYAEQAWGVELGPHETAEDVFPLGPERYRQMMDVVGSKWIDDYEPAPGCGEALEKLLQVGFGLVVVTSRSDRELEAAKHFVAQHGLPLARMINTNRGSKVGTLQQLRAIAYLDDSLWKLAELGGLGMALYFLKQPWNAHEHQAASRLEQIVSVENWPHFYERLISNMPEQMLEQRRR